MNFPNKTFQHTIDSLFSRKALNVYFWLMMMLIKMPDADDQSAYPKVFYYGWMIFFLLHFAVLSYINNFILLPRFLFAQKRLLYGLVFFVLLFGLTYSYTFFLIFLQHKFPGFDAMQVSIVMDPVGTNYSVEGVLNHMQTYFFTMLVWGFFFTLLGLYYRNRQQMSDMRAALEQHREAELAMLRTQMHPHFLFNTLNNLYGLALKNSARTPDVILQLSSVLRYMIYETNSPLVFFSKERQIIEAYLALELLRIEDATHIKWEIESDKDYQVPPLLWLSALENAFKYTRAESGPVIDFKIVIKQHVFKLICINKVSKAAASTDEVKGFGLSNLRKRLDLLFTDKYSLYAAQVEENFIFELDVQLT